MIVPKIDGYSNGINAVEKSLKDRGPYDGAYERFADTQRTLVAGHNSTLDRLAALERDVAALRQQAAMRPFG